MPLVKSLIRILKPLLQHVYYGIATNNASNEVKRVAEHVADSVVVIMAYRMLKENLFVRNEKNDKSFAD